MADAGHLRQPGLDRPDRGVARLDLARLERRARARRRIASDLNWRRLKSWRRLLSQALDPAVRPRARLRRSSEVVIEHGPRGHPRPGCSRLARVPARLAYQAGQDRRQGRRDRLPRFQAAHGPVEVSAPDRLGCRAVPEIRNDRGLGWVARAASSSPPRATTGSRRPPRDAAVARTVTVQPQRSPT